MQTERTPTTANFSPLPTPLLTEREAARYIHMSVFFLRQARRHGRGPTFHSFGRSIRYRLDDLEDWVRGRRSRRPDELGR